MPHVLVHECKNFGLNLIEIKPFEQYYNENNQIILDKNHQECSFLYSSFFFQLKK